MITADTRRPSQVFGVHGAAGLTYWKCLARRVGTAGHWEAVEWASLPPGAVSGAHRHTRTEEIYYVLRGRGELVLDECTHTVGPGSLALTRRGGVHALHNTGGTDLDWLVVEMSTPSTHAVLSGAAEPDLRRTMRPSSVYDLNALGWVDPTEVFEGPLRGIELIDLTGGEQRGFRSSGSEHVLFVVEGRGRAHGSGTEVDLVPGTAVTLPSGSGAQVSAGQGLRLFHAVMEVPA